MLNRLKSESVIKNKMEINDNYFYEDIDVLDQHGRQLRNLTDDELFTICKQTYQEEFNNNEELKEDFDEIITTSNDEDEDEPHYPDIYLQMHDLQNNEFYKTLRTGTGVLVEHHTIICTKMIHSHMSVVKTTQNTLKIP